MALRFMDGFDHYATADITKKWTSITGGSVTINAGTGRRSSGSMSISLGSANGVSKTLDAQATWIVGVAVNYTTFPTNNVGLLRFLDAGTLQCSLLVNPDGTLSVVRGSGTAVTGGTSTFALSANTFYYIEMKVTIADSIGANSCKVRVNGADVITVATGQDLKSTANATANQIGLSNSALSGSSVIVADDFYVCDSTGATNNDFLGDVRVDTLFPNAEGNFTQFTPSTGTTHYTLVDETAPNTTDYNDGATAGDRDSYALQNLSALTSQTVYGVQVNAAVLKDDAGAKSASTFVRSGGTNGDGATAALGTSQAYVSQVYELDPNGSVAWTEASVNAMEAGVRVTA